MRFSSLVRCCMRIGRIWVLRRSFAFFLTNLHRNFVAMLFVHILAMFFRFMAANMAERRNASGHQLVIVPNIANPFDQWTANLLVGVFLDLFGLSLLFYAAHLLSFVSAMCFLVGLWMTFRNLIAHLFFAFFTRLRGYLTGSGIAARFLMCFAFRFMFSCD